MTRLALKLTVYMAIVAVAIVAITVLCAVEAVAAGLVVVEALSTGIPPLVGTAVCVVLLVAIGVALRSCWREGASR